MSKCAQCNRTVKHPGQYEITGHPLCSARCFSRYSQAIARVARQKVSR